MSRARTPLQIVPLASAAPTAPGDGKNHDTPASAPAGSATQRIVDAITTAIAHHSAHPTCRLGMAASSLMSPLTPCPEAQISG